jgi:hypothetical protein
MKENSKSKEDQILDTALQSWSVTAAPAPRFREQVWQRIARAESASEPSLIARLLQHVEQLFARPALAAAYCAALLLLGSGAGYVRATHVKSQATTEFKNLYVQSVDPYQMPRRPL